MTVELELHPALTRLRRRLELCQAPLVRLWGWPRSGRRLLLRNLSHFHPQRWQALDGEGPMADQIHRADASIPHLWCPLGIDDEAASSDTVHRDTAQNDTQRSEAPESEILQAGLDALADGQRLYFMSSRRQNRGLLQEEWVRPDEWRLTLGEVSAVAEDPFSDGSVEELMTLTAGWWGPLRWLLRAIAESASEGRDVDPSMSGLLASTEFATWFTEQVLCSIPSLSLEILDACRLTTCSDPALWRLAWIESPELLRAVEEMVHLEGWLGDAWPALWTTTPWTLERRYDLLGPREEDARRRSLHRQVGLASRMVGKEDLARHHLSQSDQPLWVSLLTTGTATGQAKPALSSSQTGDLDHGQDRVFQVSLLGLPEVIDSVGATPRPVRWKLRRALMTLAYLLMAPNRRASREELIEAVWEGVEERSIEKNFHPTLSTLRRALGNDKRDGRTSPLVFRQGVYSLAADVRWSVDVDRFQSLFREGEELCSKGGQSGQEAAAELWQQAWRLYRGALLSKAEETWVVSRRRELRHVYLKLLDRLAALLGDLGRQAPALDVYRTLLMEEPFEEPVHLAVMEIYGQQGRRDLVRRQFVRLQELLRSELGVEPMAWTQERFHALMS